MNAPRTGRVPFALPPVFVFLVQSAAIAFGLSAWVTYASVRRVTELGFSAAELGLVGTVLGVSLFLFEIPTKHSSASAWRSGGMSLEHVRRMLRHRTPEANRGRTVSAPSRA